MSHNLIARGEEECKSKFCVSKHGYGHLKEYPLYVGGNIFILTQDLLQDLYKTSLTIPYMWVEDAYLTGIVREKMENVNMFFLDAHMNFGNQREFMQTLIKPDKTSSTADDIQYFITLLPDTFMSSCIWSLRLFYMSDEEIAMIGGSSKHLELWNQFTRMLIDKHMFDSVLKSNLARRGMSSAELHCREDHLYTLLGVLCSRFSY